MRIEGSLIDGLLGSPGSTISSAPPADIFTSGFDASWELDFWGRVRRQVESANAQVLSSEEQRRDALVSSLAETARDYIQLRGTQTLIRIANDNLKIQQDILELTKTRQQKGLTTSLDVDNAAAQVEAVRAQLPSLEQQEAQQINALSFLLDMPPDALRGELAATRPVPPSPARVPIGIPSELARRRPDIRAAEAQLHAATADIGVAVAEFYPTIQLNGSAGFDALKVGNLLTASAILTNVGPSISMPIFQGGRLKATLELRKAQQVEAAIAYHKTVLQAWHEVVNALVAHRTEQQRRARLALQVEHSRQALSLARVRYNDGVADFTTVLDTERTLLQAEQDHAQSTTNVSINLVQLYKALGGGWELTFPIAPPEAASGPVGTPFQQVVEEVTSATAGRHAGRRQALRWMRELRLNAYPGPHRASHNVGHQPVQIPVRCTMRPTPIARTLSRSNPVPARLRGPDLRRCIQLPAGIRYPAVRVVWQ